MHKPTYGDPIQMDGYSFSYRILDGWMDEMDMTICTYGWRMAHMDENYRLFLRITLINTLRKPFGLPSY